MPQWKVTLVFGKNDETTSIIDAETPDAAHDAAIDKARETRSFWRLPTVYAEKVTQNPQQTTI